MAKRNEFASDRRPDFNVSQFGKMCANTENPGNYSHASVGGQLKSKSKSVFRGRPMADVSLAEIVTFTVEFQRNSNRESDVNEISVLEKAPKPFFDNLSDTENPRWNPVQSERIEVLLGRCDLEAVEDFQIAAEFIFTYRGNRQTFMQYRRTTELWLTWSWLVAGKSLKEANRQDIESFLGFCANPPRSWIGKKRRPRFKEILGIRVPNPDWRPFYANGKEYKAKNSTVSAGLKTLGSLFSYLIEENYIGLNPINRIRQRSKFVKIEQEPPTPRILSLTQWHFTLEAAEELAREDPSNHERTLFMLSAMFCMYLRISEFVQSDRWFPVMGHFFKDSEGRWWFKTVGKGNKERVIAVCDDMLEALKRYRRSRGLNALPYPGEHSVLIHSLGRSGRLTSTTTLRLLCKQVFTRAACKMRNGGNIEEAEILESATPHWLRHTGISFDVPHRPLHHIRDDAGHSSIRTTNRYIGAGMAERHGSAQQKSLRLIAK